MFGDWIQSGSHLAILAVLILSGTGLPIPEEVTVVAAAIASRQDLLPVWSALACCIVGAIAGDCVMYGLGRYFGRSVLKRRWLSRFLTPAREEKIEQMVNRHGVRLFFLARFMVGIRSPMYLTCGIMRVPFLKFLIADLVSALVVVGSFFGLGYFFGEQIIRSIHGAEIGVTVAVVLAVCGFIGYHYYHLRKQAREFEESETDSSDQSRGASSDEAAETVPSAELTIDDTERDEPDADSPSVEVNGKCNCDSTDKHQDRKGNRPRTPQSSPLKAALEQPNSLHA